MGREESAFPGFPRMERAPGVPSNVLLNLGAGDKVVCFIIIHKQINYISHASLNAYFQQKY